VVVSRHEKVGKAKWIRDIGQHMLWEGTAALA
jgi:hypothetical protein